MPLHRYICQDCQHLFEYLVRNTRQLPPYVTCPACGGAQTHRFVEDLHGERGTTPAGDTPPAASSGFSLKTLGRDLEDKR
ncbi:MAG: FmdB family zinc ribbon protein [Chloroflexota bacterium]